MGRIVRLRNAWLVVGLALALFGVSAFSASALADSSKVCSDGYGGYGYDSKGNYCGGDKDKFDDACGRGYIGSVPNCPGPGNQKDHYDSCGGYGCGGHDDKGGYDKGKDDFDKGGYDKDKDKGKDDHDKDKDKDKDKDHPKDCGCDGKGHDPYGVKGLAGEIAQDVVHVVKDIVHDVTHTVKDIVSGVLGFVREVASGILGGAN
jgi:hypothetical protein